MRIGELAQRTGCQAETIRYYERAGILPQPWRARNNYRSYDQAHYRRLRFVLRCRELGFSLEEVRTLLGLMDGGDYSCAEVKALASEHLAAVRERIRGLREMESGLNELIAQCSGDTSPDCSLLETLSKAPTDHRES